LEIALRFWLLRLRQGGKPELSQRAEWLHRSCRMLARRLGIRVTWRGKRPSQGLICSNHLSYLDILVYAAAAPCVFVSKQEVARWPIFGFFARAGGSIFVDRRSRASTESVARQIVRTLEAGVPVLLFPEGTSTDGSTVQRFHPSLLDPAVSLQCDMAAAAIGYRARGVEERELCWYGDASFAPHLLLTLGRDGMVAEVEFHPDRGSYTERKSAALDLHDKVEAMRVRMRREARAL
jgi:1-acyl-sn-glycerol-3-phosphate acyltransferase